MKHMLKNLKLGKAILFVIPFFLMSCGEKPLTFQILDDAHKTFYVNGISASEGFNAVVKSLEEIGFRCDKYETLDFRDIGRGLTYYAIWENHNQLTLDQFNRLSGNLFAELPSTNWILDEINQQGCKVYICWYPSGMIKQATIQFDSFEYPEDAIEVNKRLSEIFPYNRVGNAYGYKEYYTDSNIVCWYTNNFFLSLEHR